MSSDAEPDVAQPERRFDASWGSALAELPLWRPALLAVLVSAVLAGAFQRMALNESWSKLLMMSVVYLLPLSWWLIVIRRRGYSARAVLGEAPSWSAAGRALLVALAAFVVHLGWVVLLAALDSVPESWSEPIIETESGAQDLAWALVAIVIDPPVEELGFRGVLYRRLLRRVRPVWAALGTSLVFGLLHPDVVGITLLGLALIALTRQTRSMWAPVLAHACNNAIGVSLSHIDLSLDDSAPWVIGAAQLVCLPWLAHSIWRGLHDVPPGGASPTDVAPRS